MLKFGDAHRRRYVPERVFCDDPILRLAQNETDARLVVWVTEHVVNRGEVEVHLPRVLRLERRHLQIDDAKASKLQVVEEEIDLKVFSADFEWNLAADEGEAGAEFDKELAQVLQKPSFQVTFLRLGGERQEIEVVWVLD